MPGSEYRGEFPLGFMLSRDYRGNRSPGTDAEQLDVTTFLAYLSKTGRFKTTLDFAEG
jgi:hypothetical protein